MPRRHWLLKSEPSVFSIHDLAARPKRTAPWDGVRNFQARNFLRDELAVGDGVLFHHSSTQPPGIAGTAVVVRSGYPDDTAKDPKSPHHDPRHTDAAPRWFVVDVTLEQIFPRFLPLEELRRTPGLEDLLLLRKGQRLSVQPVTPEQFAIIVRLGNEPA